MLTNYPGTQDRFTDDILLRQWILSKFQAIYRELGFHLVESPCLENVEVLSKSGGVGDQPTFTFLDKHQDPVCLKPDQTVSLRRIVEQHRLRMPFPRHQVGFAFRQDKPERGRWREFLQCDADFVGAPLGTSDAETILWLLRGFAEVGLPETVLLVNTREILRGLYKRLGNTFFDEITFVRAIDKIPVSGETETLTEYLARVAQLQTGGKAVAESESAWKKTPSDSPAYQAIVAILKLVDELKSYRNPGEAVQDLKNFGQDFPDLEEQANSLIQILEMAFAVGVDSTQIIFEPVLARGMDYYTGPVFECRTDLWKFGSLAGGGRYDNMIVVEGDPQPAVGASFGLDRIEQALKDLGRVPGECTQRLADALVITKPDWLPGALHVAKQLRESGLRTIVFPDPAVTLKLQTRFAAQNSIPCAVFFGPDEQEQGNVTIREITPERDVADPDAARKSKNMTVALAEMVETVRSLG